ncbi:alkaline phosphatase PhoX [Alcanivorax sp.]|uniref:PhoX family protein n=1 Tax=Alcanivorax sp. TaxID=1872427 RepID=UPI000C10FE51|nr:alkaline phosphatase PhoX [Alcanivorax sp.]PHR65211.1 MAG: hypothetical protein COA55_11560 [Alcanivorax sp.]
MYRIPFAKTALATKVSAVTLTALLLAACGGDSDSNDPVAPGDPAGKTLSFTAVKAPETDLEKRQILASPSVEVDGETYEIGFHTLLRSGDAVNGDVVFGQLVDKMGQPLYGNDGKLSVTDSNEHTSLLPIGDRLFSVSQMETRPGAMFLMELDQNKQTGHLSVKDLWQIDQSGVDGGWVHCAASVTPWNTHLASEEYEPDASERDPVTGEIDGYYEPMADYFGGDLTAMNPYWWGWNIEITVAAEGDSAPTSDLVKHYAMGRLAFELSYVMPDEKTVYMTDDGTNVGFYMFVADTAGDLSAGSLYAAKWNQTSAAGIGEADLEWISLGHASNSDIEALFASPDEPSFDDLFETAAMTGEDCPDGFTATASNGNKECLKVKPGMELAASRLETRRYAALMGATTEFRKEEGVTFDPDGGKLYVAMSEVGRGMEDNSSSDLSTINHVRIAEANSCGGVYALDVGSDAGIGSDYVAQNMKGLIAGQPASYSADSPFASYSCDANGLANPDNVTFITGYNTLIIGEDTGSGHQNDVIWSLNLDEVDATDFSAGLTRIQTTPYGSETTSPYWYPNVNGFAYLMSVVQHPYGESDSGKIPDGSLDHRAYTGYVGPFPAMD